MLVETTQRADEEIEAYALFYAAEASAEIAYAFSNAVKATKVRLGEMPGTGSNRYGYLLPGVKFVHIGRFPFLAFYLIQDDRVLIIRVLHERRNLPDQLTH